MEFILILNEEVEKYAMKSAYLIIQLTFLSFLLLFGGGKELAC